MHSVKFYGINAAGIKSKQKSFENVLNRIKPQVWTIQETKLKPNETIKCEALDHYQVYYLSRQESQGGGLALGVLKELESTLIREGDDNTEILSVQVVVGDISIRVVSGYGPQENANISIKEKFWEFLEEEINQAHIENQGLLLQMDGNLHAGPQLLEKDPNPQNKNGKMFMNFLERNPNLIVVNTLDICQGLITRKRAIKEHVKKNNGTIVRTFCEECKKIFFTEKELTIHKRRDHSIKIPFMCYKCKTNFTGENELETHIQMNHEKTEESVLDFMIVNEKLSPFLHKMLIDEDRIFSLTNLAQITKNKRIIESDHNPIILDLNIQYSKRKPDRIEMFNLKNKACQELFKLETENNQELMKVFDTDFAFEEQCKDWLKIFNSILHKCFKKVRIVSSRKQEEKESKKELFERAMLQKELKSGVCDEATKNRIKKRIDEIENDIENEIGEENINEIVQTLKELGGNEKQLGPNGRKQMWKILKDKFPSKNSPCVPIGKKDTSGNVITNYEGLKHVYLDLLLLRKILNAPKSTPKEMLFLELGCIRLRDIIKHRRLLYLHYILNEPTDSMIHKFLTVQLKSRNKKDWVTTVLKDLEELEIRLNFEEIRSMKKAVFQRIVKKCVNAYAFKSLEKQKLNHTKVKDVTHRALEIRTYFLPNEFKATKEEIQTIFKLRCRMTDLKTNMKGIYNTYECPLCGVEDTQIHILQECKIVENMKKNKTEEHRYEMLYENDAKVLIEMARKFIKNFEMREKALKGET